MDPRGKVIVVNGVSTGTGLACARSLARERFGHTDAVVNNAGKGSKLAFGDSTDPSVTRALFEVHVFGMERVSRAVLPSMLARGSGTIVNIASTVAWVPMPAAAAYCAAKDIGLRAGAKAAGAAAQAHAGASG
jgi:NADP-dependent 3-hydroxy acid dehydrogenase YdfG